MNTKRALLITLSPGKDGYAISLDDAILIDQGNSDSYVRAEHVTHKVYGREEFDELKFDDKELAERAGPDQGSQFTSEAFRAGPACLNS